ncbi:MAG: helix-turn-helix transcriptional regulator, partial [Anaerotignum sp.]|nr:helix-turn-helix transcriptional regulator [Anaerotignum sp.]
RREASEKITCRDVAEAVFLSESRFSHLFKEQVGMTFSAYLIYQRIMKVYTQVLDGKSITEAALAAGFSGSSHFADVNRRVFGLSARNITEDMIFKKV